MIKNSLQRVLAGSVLAALLALGLGAGCKRKDVPADHRFSGVVEFDEKILSFELGGRVSERPVDRGDVVQRGQRLALLDDTLESASRAARESELSAAESRVALLEAGPKREDVGALVAQVDAARAQEKRISDNLERERQLAARGVTPSAVVDDLNRDLERAKAQRAGMEAQLASLKRGARSEEIDTAKSQAAAVKSNVALESERVERHELKAPSEGVVLDVHVEAGETVAPGTPVVTVGNVAHPLIEIFVPQQDLGGIHVGQAADVRIDALSKSLPGKVEFISRKTEFTPRYLFSDRERPNLVVRVRVRIDDPKRELFAGVPAFVALR
jgi:HlyD family secretion protein